MKTIEFENGMLITLKEIPGDFNPKRYFPFKIAGEFPMKYTIRQATEEESSRAQKRLDKLADEHHDFQVNEHQRLTGDVFLQNFKPSNPK